MVIVLRELIDKLIFLALLTISFLSILPIDLNVK